MSVSALAKLKAPAVFVKQSPKFIISKFCIRGNCSAMALAPFGVKVLEKNIFMKYIQIEIIYQNLVTLWGYSLGLSKCTGNLERH